jgi:hypothetical protein
MKWKYFQLAKEDARAKAQIVDNLTMGAHEHTLSRKLLARVADVGGPIVLIAFESLDLDYPHLYKYAAYNGGRPEPVDAESFCWTDAPHWGLVELVDNWLHSSRDATVVCENLTATREIVRARKEDGTWESRILCAGDNEVYHVLTNDDRGNLAVIEATLRESQDFWATGVCSRCADVPSSDLRSESFFDQLVANTKQIFVPALDSEGFLVWWPEVPNSN